MKKTLSLLLCIVLISCLVSCDLSMIWNSIRGTTESTTTTTTEPPVYETVKLTDLIDINRLSSVRMDIYKFVPMNDIMRKICDIEEKNEISELLNVIYIDIQEYTSDIYYKTIWREEKENLKNNINKIIGDHPMSYYVIHLIFYYEDYSGAAILTIYPNNQIDIYDGKSKKHYYNLENQDNCWEEIMNKYVLSDQGGN